MQTSYFGYFGHAWLHNQLVEDFSVYLQVQNIFHYSLLFWDITFKRILQFDWLTAFRLITQEPEFCQIWDCGGDINSISFHFRYFSKKTNHKIFQKISKTLFWDHFGPFLPKFRKKINIPEKKSCQFLDIPIIYHRAKNQKKLTNHF